MVIRQNNYKYTRIGKSLLSDVKLHINLKELETKLGSIKEEINATKNKTNKKNLQGLLDMLSKLEKSAEKTGGGWNVNWHLDNHTLKMTPLNIVDSYEYDVCFTDYIQVGRGKTKLLKLDYSALAKAIALELMSYEYDLDYAVIGENLNHISIVGSYPIEKLFEAFEEGVDYYADSKFLRVSRTNYITETNELKDYFYEVHGKDDKYVHVVESSCRKALLMVLSQIAQRLQLEGISDIKLCGFSATSLSFIYSDWDGDSTSKLLECLDEDASVSVRVFGRIFNMKPIQTLI